ncbi:uncharacterized protein predicted to be involved in DNA repair [Candidatus Methanoperedens nitroreducens]|uniref:Uncharacterized protein predicted to be involved in DNA repair n=2 Tax=Candidatus Methanoperedens nitratireducens TaxID=1392998 RepID=A0A062VDV9_9EURY|nr:uncharacterized protein predicted to be involved in DNA repair [Candidatus Methanoperedens nitroreducens]
MVVSGEHNITTGAIRLLLENGIDIVILDSFGNPAGYILPCGKSRQTPEGCIISNKFKKQYAGAILTRLEQEYSYESKKRSFSEIIDLQAEKLATAILETGKYTPFIYR